ncbi:hypothetical protein RHSIM_Rhsim05G0142600 [Rhododendron simsii]|uniref:Pierisin-like domain-containing protein n=1 Tax=Rhododendron simsii TaxID=118357 RepID=A0A834GWH5_RHOSS|nr:hypothetical protein RHSIM_Rhsim05G0142600 [Rhododendron simsii]
MSIPPDSPWRGCASNYNQPISEDDQLEAQFWLGMLDTYNCIDTPNPLPSIVYRNSSGEQDIRNHVFRWDDTPYQEAFQNGFRSRRQEGTLDTVYASLDHYVHHGGRPLDSRRAATHVFVSTTLSSSWHPTVDPGTERIVYRYEIYAPGGIWVAATLRDRYRFEGQDEVSFVGGIAPQYIRSAQAFLLSAPAGSRSRTNRRRVDNVLILNGNFNPQRSLRLRYEIFRYRDEESGEYMPLNHETYPPGRTKRQVSITDSMNYIDLHGGDVANSESYINAAFRSVCRNEAYLFMNNEYVLVDYAPGSTDDRVLNGPLRICEGFPSLRSTTFAEYGIDCAFGSHHGDEAFIFSGNLCAQINYAPGTTDDKIIKGPMAITDMFPFFKGTVFESSIDASFEATARNEAYLFKGNQYALINYNNPNRIAIRRITEGFASLKDTIFESGIEAAFASHNTDEAYLFKEDCYALINYAPGTTDDYIIGGVKKILPNWPSLSGIWPREDCGLDVHDHTQPDPDRDQDELHEQTEPNPYRGHDEL